MPQFDGISPAIRTLLIQAGWRPDRQSAIADTVAKLQEEGFIPNSTALEILKSFGGLRVQIPASDESPYEHEISFEPFRAATGESDRAIEWKHRIGIELFPIGEEVSSGNVLWVGSDGQIYYGRGFGLYLIGDSLASAMDWLISPTSPPTLCAE